MVEITGEAALAVQFHGVRGSIPVPGPGTARYGGNTACVEVRSDAGRVVLDAGTGIRALGADLVRARPEKEWGSDDGVREVHVFLTHYHWDHIQGLPFFEPLFEPGVTLRLYGPESTGGVGAWEAAIGAQLGPDQFPGGLDAIAARVVTGRAESPWRKGGLEVDALQVHHPGVTLAYRVRVAGGGAAIAYVPDCELEGDGETAPDPGWYDRLVGFLRGVTLLVHDAMYDDDEHVHRRGWGHSTPAQAVRLAAAAGVPRLWLFHHAPWRDDAAVTARVRMAAASPDARAAGLEVGAAAEGECLVVQPLPVRS
jgi:phosphoribosyl 1,2-cyclic phosphodiesterase